MIKKPQKTAQRAAILAYLEGNRSHPSVNEIYQAVSQKISTISLATVYNTLTLLERMGLIRQVIAPGIGAKRYDTVIVPHDHLICVSCGKIVDVRTSLRNNVPDQPLQGFDIHQVSSSLFGLCPQCKKKGKSSARK